MPNVRTEEFHVNGEELLSKIKKLVHEGNIRKIIIKDKDGKVYLSIKSFADYYGRFGGLFWNPPM